MIFKISKQTMHHTFIHPSNSSTSKIISSFGLSNKPTSLRLNNRLNRVQLLILLPPSLGSRAGQGRQKTASLQAKHSRIPSSPSVLLAMSARVYDGMYVEVSICSGSSLMSTSNRSCTWLRTSESEADETKVMASPLVPKRPALPTLCK